MPAKFRELGSACQVFLWLRIAGIKMPVMRRNVDVCKMEWKLSAYHGVMQILHNPLYAGAYGFGRMGQRTDVGDGRSLKISGYKKPREEWSTLIYDHHPGYISWQDFEENQRLLLENAHMKKINGCMRHIMVDTDGRPLLMQIHTADVQDRDGAVPLPKPDEPEPRRAYMIGGLDVCRGCNDEGAC